MSQPEVPYQLAFDPTYQMPCARGGPKEMAQLRSIVGSYDMQTYVMLPNTRASYVMLEAIANPENASEGYVTNRRLVMAPVPEHMAWIKQAVDFITDLPSPLLESQYECMVFGYPRNRFFNASEQGTGKTLTDILLAYLWDCRRVIVIAPKDVIPEWGISHNHWLKKAKVEAFEIWTSDESSTLQKMQALQILARRPNRFFYVTNFHSISKTLEHLKELNADLLIIDESHNVKSEAAQMTKAVMDLALSVPRVINNSGTPIGNDVGDLWTQVRMLNPTLLMPTYKDFMNRYAMYVPVLNSQGNQVYAGGGMMRKAVGCLDPAGLMKNLESIWFRATKATSFTLPAKRYYTVELELPLETRKLYEEVKRDGEFALGNHLSLNGQMVVALRLQQIAGGHATMFSQRDEMVADEDTGTMFRRVIMDKEQIELPCVKIEWLKSWAEQFLLPYPQKRAIIWCRFNAEVKRITRELKLILGNDRVFSVMGGTTNKHLTPVKESFNSRDPEGTQVLVAQVDKMYSGHNLQAGDYHIEHSMTWSYLKRAQSHDRSHRLGREEEVWYITLVASHTMDEVVLAAQNRKQDLAVRLTPHTISGVTEDNDGTSMALVEEELIEQLGLMNV